MSNSNTTIVQDLQRAVTAFNNIETAINSSGLPNTPVENYPQAIEDLKHGSGGNVEAVKYEYATLTEKESTIKIEPSSGYDSMGKVELHCLANIKPDIVVKSNINIERVEIKKDIDYENAQLVDNICIANSLNTSGTNKVGVADETTNGIDLESLLCGFNSDNADIKLMSKYTYEEYDETAQDYVSKTKDTPVKLTGGLRNCKCQYLIFGDATNSNELTVRNTKGIIDGLNCKSLIPVPDVSPIDLHVASVGTNDLDITNADIGVLGDSNTTIDSQYMSLLDSPGLHLYYKGAYDNSTGLYNANKGGINLYAFGILPSHGGRIVVSADVMSNIVESYPETYGSAAPGTTLHGDGINFTFGSNSIRHKLSFVFTSMTAAEFEASKLFITNFIDANTSGAVRELKFSAAASAASGFSDFKTAMEAKGYTITVE